MRFSQARCQNNRVTFFPTQIDMRCYDEVRDGVKLGFWDEIEQDAWQKTTDVFNA